MSPETYLSAYPSFILSGLLSPPSSSPSSLHSRDSFDLGPRRGSLPTDSPPSYYSSTADDASMFYFALQPRRDKDEFRSFLSLDLAESQSLRSHSTRRKPSSKRHSREPPFAVDFQIPDSPSLLPPRSPIGLRKSPTNSLRALPSPKPAPVSSLPSVPSHPSSPRSQTLEVAVSRTPTPVAIQAVPQRKASVMSQATRASATTSTVSTRYRRTRRNKALACLEGRRPVVRPPSSGNFMSFSDNESEDEEEPVSVPQPPLQERDSQDLSDDQLIMLIAKLDGRLEDYTAPTSPLSKPSTRGTSVRSTSLQPQPRRRKTKLGLKSFMDFHNEEDTSRWSWRSFIEVAT
ncbi:hypothetical protein B0H19DRAFT_1251667 [Mycena capillaripes]|nr:hypothetical protein B0H19DRAFT_1251667 [Mycena capillaripes]